MTTQYVIAHVGNWPLEQKVVASGAFWPSVQPVQFSDTAQIDAAGRLRVSQMETLIDGKSVYDDDTLLWDTKGTGTGTWANGIYSMSVTAGQYFVRQTRVYAPYFSGKTQFAEITFDTFAKQAGVIKRVGYFSSSAVAPYDSNLDGWWLESDGDANTIDLVIANAGAEKLRLRIGDWDAYQRLKSYDWDNFTVIIGDFLWLGGALHRFFVKDPAGGFANAACFDYAGTAQGTFMRSPNQPVRYEIRSTTGAGSFRAICSQVSTEGQVAKVGQAKVLYHTTILNANSIGTIYAVKGVKKNASYRDVAVTIEEFGGGITSLNDTGVWMLLRNPTLSAPLTYVANGRIDEATATTQTVSSVGRAVEAIHVKSAGTTQLVQENALMWLGMQIDNTPDEYVLAYMPLTTNQTINGSLHVVEY